jgi:hypothetical protein
MHQTTSEEERTNSLTRSKKPKPKKKKKKRLKAREISQLHDVHFSSLARRRHGATIAPAQQAKPAHRRPFTTPRVPTPKSTWRICMYLSIYPQHTRPSTPSPTRCSLSLSLSPSQCHNPRPQHQHQLMRTATRNKRKHTRYTLTHEKLTKSKYTHKKMLSCGRGTKRPRKGHRRKDLLLNSYLNEPLVRNWPNGALLRWLEEAGGWIDGIFI